MKVKSLHKKLLSDPISILIALFFIAPPVGSVAFPAYLNLIDIAPRLTLEQELQAILHRHQPSPGAHRRAFIEDVIRNQYKRLKITSPVPVYSQQVIDAIHNAYLTRWTPGRPFLIDPELNWTWRREIVQYQVQCRLTDANVRNPGKRLLLRTPLPEKEVDRLYLLLMKGVYI